MAEACPECGGGSGGPLEFAFVSREEYDKTPDRCPECHRPLRFTFNIQKANAQDLMVEGCSEP
jgi:hypothetical protein